MFGDPQTHPRHIYIYIEIYAVESKPGPGFGGFLSQNLVQGCVKTWSKIFFCLFFPSFVVFFGYLKKTQIVCTGAKNFWQFVKVVKKRVFEKKCALFVFVFFMLEKEKDKT